MAQRNLELALRIRADLEQARRALNDLETTLGGVSNEMEGVSGAARNAGSALSGFAKAALAFVSLATLRYLSSLSDAYGQNASRIRNATDSTEDYEKVQARLLDTANGTYRALGEAQEVYLATSRTLKALGYSLDDVLDISDSLSYAFVRDAASTDRAKNAMDAYSKSLAKGRVDADAWASIIAAAPSIIDNIATASGKSALEIQKMGAEGKLSLQQLNEGLRQSLAENKAAADEMSVSTRDATVQLTNALTVFAGKVNEASGASDVFATAMANLSRLLRDPATIDAAVTMANGIVTAFGWIVTAAKETVGIVKWAAEEMAARMHGAASDDIVRLEDQLGRLQFRLGQLDDELARPRVLRNNPLLSTEDFQAERKKIEAEIELTRQQIERYYKLPGEVAGQAGSGGGNGSGKPGPTLPETPSEEFTKAQADLERRIAMLGRESAAQQMLWEVESGRYKDLAQNEKDALVALARRMDAGTAEQKSAKESAQDAKRRADEARRWVEQLERQAAVMGMSAGQVRAYELAEKNLAGALRTRALAALAAVEADERRRQADKNAQASAGLEAEYLRALGQTADAATVEMNARFAKMREEFVKDGNEAGLAWIEKLIPVTEARARLDEIQREINDALAAQTRREQSIDAQVSAGLITQMEARRQLVDLHRETADVVERYLPALREMASMPGAMGEAARAALENLETQVLRLRTTTNELQNALRNGLQNGIEEALTGLANGTLTLQEAVTSLVQSIASSMAQLAAQQLAEQAAAGVMSLFGQTAGAGAETAGAMATQAAAAALATAAGGVSIAAGGVTTGASALGSSSGLLTSAASMLQPGAAAVGQAAIQLQSAASMMMAANAAGSGIGFATGGHVRGPGTGTSDSIPAWLSDNEYVTRAAVVRQPGALGFLHDFNARGMAALNDWAKRVRHATGGIAGIPAPSMPAPGLAAMPLAEPAKMMSTSVSNRMRVYLLNDEDSLAQRLAQHPAMEKAVVAIAGQNGNAIRAEW